jgi:hypothetical protein
VDLFYRTGLIDALIATRWTLIAFFAFVTTRSNPLRTRGVTSSRSSTRSAHRSNSRLRLRLSCGLRPEWNIRPIGV